MHEEITISNSKYYHYGQYTTREKAMKIAKKKRNIIHRTNGKIIKARHFIIEENKGYPLPKTIYHLYLNKKIQWIKQ